MDVYPRGGKHWNENRGEGIDIAGRLGREGRRAGRRRRKGDKDSGRDIHGKSGCLGHHMDTTLACDVMACARGTPPEGGSRATLEPAVVLENSARGASHVERRAVLRTPAPSLLHTSTSSRRYGQPDHPLTPLLSSTLRPKCSDISTHRVAILLAISIIPSADYLVS